MEKPVCCIRTASSEKFKCKAVRRQIKADMQMGHTCACAEALRALDRTWCQPWSPCISSRSRSPLSSISSSSSRNNISPSSDEHLNTQHVSGRRRIFKYRQKIKTKTTRQRGRHAGDAWGNVHLSTSSQCGSGRSMHVPHIEAC